jgi:hypothetical protein
MNCTASSPENRRASSIASSIATGGMLAEVEQGRLVAIPLHAPELVRPAGIVHRKRKRLNRAAQSGVIAGGAESVGGGRENMMLLCRST